MRDHVTLFSRIILAAVASLLISGCGHSRTTQQHLPAAPAIDSGSSEHAESGITEAESAPDSGRALYTEIGMASWYGPSYNHRKSANGEVYDMHGLTAAHRTIPLNSIARVTNIATGESVKVRITDRGPFVTDRVIDLSMAAAQKVGVYRHGTAKVKIEVLQSPARIERGGRWAVQIGAFSDEDAASKMKSRLVHRYKTARVLQFEGPRQDWWVRVRVLEDKKERAQEVARDNRTSEGAVFLVRLD